MDDLLQQGITAYKAGKQDEARKLFITAVKQSPDNERTWGWMYQVSNNDQEKTHCLKQILRINPKSEKAKQMLETLTGNDFPFELSQKITSPIQEQKNSALPNIQNKIPITSQEKSDSSQQNNSINLTGQIVRGILIAIGIIICIIVGIYLLAYISISAATPKIGSIIGCNNIGSNDNAVFSCLIIDPSASNYEGLESLMSSQCSNDNSTLAHCEVHAWTSDPPETLPFTDSQLSTRFAQYYIKSNGMGCFIAFQYDGKIEYQTSECDK